LSLIEEAVAFANRQQTIACMYGLLRLVGSVSQSVIQCIFSTDFTCCTEVVFYISLTLATLCWRVGFTEPDIRVLDTEKARTCKETILGIQ